MFQLIKTIGTQTRIEFGPGAFDNWCVYISEGVHIKYAPKDTEYFSIIKSKSLIYGCQKLYQDFLSIYILTKKEVDISVLELITTLSKYYGDDSIEMDKWFTVLYAGMVAEENKDKAILKKRIKRLGMHQLLMEDYDPFIAANFSKGKKWKELDRLMKERGF